MIYIIYISSSETGDVKLAKAYSSFSNASNNLNTIIDWYIKTNCIGANTKVLNKEKSIETLILNDNTFPNGFVFCMKKNSVIIYKKTTDLGWLRNGKSVKKIGKIGIDELSVQLSDNNNNAVVIDNTASSPTSSNVASSLEHGQHVSLIEELKDVIGKRSGNIPTDIVQKPVINLLREKFITDLKVMKTKLRSVPSSELLPVLPSSLFEDMEDFTIPPPPPLPTNDNFIIPDINPIDIITAIKLIDIITPIVETSSNVISNDIGDITDEDWEDDKYYANN
jgi:hypothetical protein